MTDEELAEELEFHVKHGIHPDPLFLSEASERIRALSAHVALLKASLAQAEREALELARSTPADKAALPSSISRDLLGRIIDECFDGAIEDCSVIEDIYSAIVRYAKECAPQPAANAEPRDDDPTTREEYRNMFHAAVSSLAAISDALGCDPDEGGAEPIIAAIKDLKGDSSCAEPFGYFRVTPFGWEDCAETDEGAIALYERPAPTVVSDQEGHSIPIYSAPRPDRVAKELVRFCPGCGSVGPVPAEYHDCCPDGSKARAAVAAEREACADAESDAGRLALELECLLLSTDMPAASRWWDSANEALDLHRSRLDAIRARGEKGGE